MRVGLIDVDSHNFPNLCLMKLSEYHSRRGDRVEWWDPAKQYDLVYKSRVFTDTYSKDTIQVSNADKVIQGGTGYGPGENLPHEIEHIRPDYFLYPRFLGTAYGFLSRGCPRNCGFCIVSGKEGRRSVRVADLSEFWNGEEEIKLMDPNLLACPDHERLIEQLIESRALVDFTQGLDIRLISRDNVSLLNKVRTKAVHFAWDNPDEDLSRIQSKVLFGLTKRQVICFGAAALVGVPLFFLAKASLGTTTAALCMILVMLPFFLFAMYEKNGQPLEVFLGHLIQNKFIRPKVRIYQTNNLYSALVRQSQLEQEVKRIARKGRKTGKA